jgi:hypothetical protein
MLPRAPNSTLEMTTGTSKKRSCNGIEKGPALTNRTTHWRRSLPQDFETMAQYNLTPNARATVTIRIESRTIDMMCTLYLILIDCIK